MVCLFTNTWYTVRVSITLVPCVVMGICRASVGILVLYRVGTVCLVSLGMVWYDSSFYRFLWISENNPTFGVI